MRRTWRDSRVCAGCGADYIARQPRQAYCTNVCGCRARRRLKTGFSRGETEYQCGNCKLFFFPFVRQQVYCSRRCRSASHKVAFVHPVPINTGVIGAMSELVVSADLLRRGFYVFRSLSQSSPCDLIALRDNNHVLRIEVSTAWEGSNGKLYTSKNRASEKYDVLALVLPQTNAVTYEPTIEHVISNFTRKTA